MEQWIARLSKIEAAAKGTPLKRLLFSPWAYITGILHHRLVYRLTKRSWRRQATTFFDAPMTVLLPAGLDIFLLKAKTHDSELRLARYLIQHLKQGYTVLDIGAHYGFFTLLASKLIGEKGKVMAIEAAASTFPMLKENVAPHANIEALHIAASNTSGIVHFFEFPSLYSEYNTSDPVQYKQAVKESGIEGKEVLVEAIAVDELLRKYNTSAHFIKIDVEGAEALVLSGMTEWLKNKQGQLVMEYLVGDEQNTAHQKAVAILKQYGWTAYYIDSEGYPVDCPDIEAHLKRRHLHSDNILFQPG
jgi:FkbM family methyltransferase